MEQFGLSREEAKPLPRRTPATISVKYRGGAECFWEVKYGGRTVRVPGHLQFHDVMRELFPAS
jgi:hypothetical protein